MAEETANVAEEIQHEEVVHPNEQSAPESQSLEAEAKQKEISDKEINFQKLREKAERLERENAELRHYASPQTQRRQMPEEVEDDLGIDDDDIPDGKLVKKLYKEIDSLKKTYNLDKQATIPERLKSKFSDFDRVVTKDNLEKLQQTEPEIYSSIVSGVDLYAKGVSAYKTLKALGIVKEDPYVSQKEQVKENVSRPVSTQAIKGQGALAEANIFAKGLTPELKQQLQREMEEAIKAR